jgi:lipopolysaccharide transport system permease protein
VGQFFTIVLQFWFWLTPIVYPASILPQWVARYMAWNPMARLIGACQDILVYGRWPQWEGLLPVLLLSALLCLLGLRLFRRHAGEMVDEL